MSVKSAALLALLALSGGAGTGWAQSPAAARAPRQSWTADRRAFRVGDVVTVLVDEYTQATLNKGESSSDSRSRSLGLGAAATGAVTLPVGSAEISSRNAAGSDRSGVSTRQNRFRGEMTVRVTEVGEGGLLHVEGRKELNVDRSREEVSLTGWVRPQDVSAENTIDSWRVGDARIVYLSHGSLGRPRGGIVTRLLGWLWP